MMLWFITSSSKESGGAEIFVHMQNGILREKILPFVLYNTNQAVCGLKKSSYDNPTD